MNLIIYEIKISISSPNSGSNLFRSFQFYVYNWSLKPIIDTGCWPKSRPHMPKADDFDCSYSIIRSIDPFWIEDINEKLKTLRLTIIVPRTYNWWTECDRNKWSIGGGWFWIDVTYKHKHFIMSLNASNRECLHEICINGWICMCACVYI